MSENDEDGDTLNTGGEHELHELVFATSLGVDLEEEFAPELVDLAVEALYVLPENWEVRFIESEMGQLPYFFDLASNRKYWTHPFIDDLKTLIADRRIELVEEQGSQVSVNSLAGSAVNEGSLQRMKEKKERSPRLKISPRISPRAGQQLNLDESIQQIVQESKSKSSEIIGIEERDRSVKASLDPSQKFSPRASPRVSPRLKASEIKQKLSPPSQKASPKEPVSSEKRIQADEKSDQIPSGEVKVTVAETLVPLIASNELPHISEEKEDIARVEASVHLPSEEKEVFASIDAVDRISEEKEEIPTTEETIEKEIEVKPELIETTVKELTKESAADSASPTLESEIKSDSPTVKIESPSREEEIKDSKEEETNLDVSKVSRKQEEEITSAELKDQSTSEILEANQPKLTSEEFDVTEITGIEAAEAKRISSLDESAVQEVEEKDVVAAPNTEEVKDDQSLIDEHQQTEAIILPETSITAIKSDQTESIETKNDLPLLLDVVEAKETADTSPEMVVEDAVEQAEKSLDETQAETTTDQVLPKDEIISATTEDVLSEDVLEQEKERLEEQSVFEPDVETPKIDLALLTNVAIEFVQSTISEGTTQAESKIIATKLQEEALENERKAMEFTIEKERIEKELESERQRIQSEVAEVIESIISVVEGSKVQEEREIEESGRQTLEIITAEPDEASEVVDDQLEQSHESLFSIHKLSPQEESDFALLEEMRSIHEQEDIIHDDEPVIIAPPSSGSVKLLLSPKSVGSTKKSPFTPAGSKAEVKSSVEPKVLFKDEFPDFFKVESAMVEALDQHPKKSKKKMSISSVGGSSLSIVTSGSSITTAQTVKSTSSQRKLSQQSGPSYYASTVAADQKKASKVQSSTKSLKEQKPSTDEGDADEEEEEQETIDIDQISRRMQKSRSKTDLNQTVDRESEPLLLTTTDALQLPQLIDEDDKDISERINNILSDDRFPSLPPTELDKTVDITEHFKQMFPTSAEEKQRKRPAGGGDKVVMIEDTDEEKSIGSLASKRSHHRLRREISELSTGSSKSKGFTPSPASHMKMMRKVSIISKEFSIDQLNQELGLAVPEEIAESVPGRKKQKSPTKKARRRTKSPSNVTGPTGWITIEAYNHYKDAEKAIEVIESFYPIQPMNKEIISCTSKLFPNLEEITNQQPFPSPSKTSHHPHRQPSPTSASPNTLTEQQQQQEMLNKLKAFETLQKTSKTIQINLEKELPKLRITRDFSKMQWLVECNDKSVKRVFQQRLQKKWPVNAATTTMIAASPVKRPPFAPKSSDYEPKMNATTTTIPPNKFEDSVDHLRNSMSNPGLGGTSSATTSNNNNNNNNAFQGEYKASFTIQAFMTNSNSKHVSSVVPVSYHIPKAQLNRLKAIPLHHEHQNTSPNELNRSGQRLSSAGKLAMLNSTVQTMASLQHLQTLDPTISNQPPIALIQHANSFQGDLELSNNKSFSALIFARPKSLN